MMAMHTGLTAAQLAQLLGQQWLDLPSNEREACQLPSVDASINKCCSVQKYEDLHEQLENAQGEAAMKRSEVTSS
jgi:hypothetical protein